MLTFSEANTLFSYDPETGIVTRKISRSNAVRIGSVVGSLHHDGYLTVWVGDRSYMLHRVIWLMQTGEWPPHELDHKNGCRAENRWDNLRCATKTQNMHNRKTPNNNKSGVMGVYWYARIGKWRAQINVNGTNIRLLDTDSKEEAIVWRNAFAELAHGEFARAA